MAFELTPWRPFRELSTLRGKMDRLWDRFFGERLSIEPFRGLAGSERASNSPKAIVEGAYDGRIEILIVAVGIQQWGLFDSKTRQVHLYNEPEPGDEDMLDFAAVHTFLNGGKVYAVKPDEMPDEAPVAAVFRY